MINKKLEICKRYESTAKAYDKRYIDIQYQKFREILEKVPLSNKWLILDVGGGTGLLKDFIPSLNRNIFILDLSFSMLKEARKKDKESFVICGDGENLPFRDKIFDIITCISTLQNMPEPLKSLREQKRVAKKGAKIIVTVLKKSYSKNDLREIVEKAGLDIIEMFQMKIEDIATIVENK